MDQDQSRDDKSSSRDKQTLPRGRGSSSLQLENMTRQPLADISLRNLERFTLAYFAWRGSKLPLSSFKYPIMEPYPFHLDDRYTVRTHFPIPPYNETGWQRRLSLPSSNTRESNLGLEQTNQQHHYQPEAFVGVNVGTDGSLSLSSSLSSLNFPTEPPSNQRNDKTNLPEEARMDGSFMFRPLIPIPSHSDTMARPTNEKNPQESNLGVNMQMDGSSSTSSLNFLTEPPSNQRYLGNYTISLTKEAVTNETARHHGLSLPPSNHQESNLGLEQTDQLFDYQLEAFAGITVQSDGSSSSTPSSYLNFPEEPPSNPRNSITNLPEEARRSYPASSMFSSPFNSPSHNEPQGMVPPQPQPWNPQDFDLGLEPSDYQLLLEAFPGVNEQMDGSSSSSSLQISTEPPPPSNQRYCGNNTTNFSEEATLAGIDRSNPFFQENRPDTTFGYGHPVAAPPITDISASRGNLNFGHFSSQVIGGEGGSSSSQEPNPKRQKMKENAFNAKDLYLLTQSPSVSTRMYQSSNPSASPPAQMNNRHEYTVHRSVPTQDPTNLPQRPSLHFGQTFPLPGQGPRPRPSIIDAGNQTPFIPPSSIQASPQTEGRSDGEGDDKK